MLFRFRPPTPDDAAMLLDWRTDPDITRFMFTDIIDGTVEKQRDWLAAMAQRSDFRHFIIEHDGAPLGYLNYADINWLHRRCSSGSYMMTDYARKMLAGYLYAFIMDYAFYGLGMHKLVNYFMDGNDKIIKIQRMVKHREVGILKDHIFKYDRFHDVYVFELLESEWRHHPRAFTRDQTLAAFPPAET